MKRFGNKTLRFPAENLEKRKCYDDQRDQVISSRITMRVNVNVKYGEPEATVQFYS